MLRKIILENFMSHGRTEIDLADGLTVLTGPNNCGKSAVVAALQIVANNGKTTHVMRHGTKVCRVTVETDDGHTVVWERKGKTVKYTLDGEDIHRIGQATPDSLHDILRLDRVQADTGKAKHDYDIHFGEQKSPVFLLGETGSRAASFFASSSDASRLVEMQHLHRANLRDRKADAKRMTAKKEANQQRLTAYEPLDQIAKSVSKAESMQNEIESVDRRIEKLKGVAKSLAQMIKNQDHLAQRHKTLFRLERTTTSPLTLQQDADNCDRLGSLSGQLAALTAQQALLKKQHTIYEPLIIPPIRFDVGSLHSLISELKEVSRRIQVSRRVLARCESLESPPALERADACNRIIRQLRNATLRLQLERRSVAALSSLSLPPELAATIGLQTLLQRLTEAVVIERKAGNVVSAIVTLERPPEFDSIDRLQVVVSELSGQRRKAHRLEVAANALIQLKETEEPVAVDRVRDKIDQLRSATSAVASTYKASAEAQRAVDRCETKLRAFVEQNPTCAVCGGSIDPETLMSAAPSIHHHVVQEVADE
jgi:exonuclease SbcC